MAFPYHKTHIFRLLRSCWPVAIPISSGGRVGAALVIPGGLLFRLSLARVCVLGHGVTEVLNVRKFVDKSVSAILVLGANGFPACKYANIGALAATY